MLTALSPYRGTNALLDALTDADRRLVLDAAKPVELVFDEQLCDPGSAMKHVYFPIAGYISLLTSGAVAEPLEIGMAGDEGMFGASLALGNNRAILGGLVQGNGAAHRVTAFQFKRLLSMSPSLTRVVHAYLYVTFEQANQVAACNHSHGLTPRLARWLLMMNDRLHGPVIPLTHQFLASMLGVRRAGVTEAAHELKASGVIEYTRGRVTIISRAALETRSCGCYTAMRATYDAHIGTRRSGGASADRRRSGAASRDLARPRWKGPAVNVEH